MQLGVAIQPVGPDGDGSLTARNSELAERLGFDHLIMGSRVLDTSIGSAMDPIVLASLISGATSRIKIVTSVLVLPFRNPVILANQVASLDAVSQGRFVLGVGTGWDEKEFETTGIPHRERGARTSEHLDVLKTLWSHRPADYEGKFTSFKQATLGVAPHTPGGPPVWVGGLSDAALLRALRFGEAWHGSGADAPTVSKIRLRLQALSGRVGRDHTTLRLTNVGFLTPPGVPPALRWPGRLLGGPVPTRDSVLEELGLLAQAGISSMSLWMPVAAQAIPDALAWVAEEILPAVTDLPDKHAGVPLDR